MKFFSGRQPCQDVKTFMSNSVAVKASRLITYSNSVHPGPMDSPQLHHTYAFEPRSASLHNRSCLQGNICYKFVKAPDHTKWGTKSEYTQNIMLNEAFWKEFNILCSFLQVKLSMYNQWRYNSTHSEPWHQMEVGGQHHALSALPPDKQPLIATEQMLGGHQSQSVCFGNKKNFLSISRIKPRFIGCPAYSNIISVGMPSGTHGRWWPFILSNNVLPTNGFSNPWCFHFCYIFTNRKGCPVLFTVNV